MGKYAQGTVSPDGKYVVQGGTWVPVEATAGPTPAPRPQGLSPTEEMANARMAGAANVPGWAVPASAALLSGAAFPAMAGEALKDAAIYGGAKGAEMLGVLPQGAANFIGAVNPVRALFRGGKALIAGKLGQLMESEGAQAVAAAEPAVARAAAGGAAEAAAAPAASQANKTVVRDFVKRMAPNAKWGEKIHVKLDETGSPVGLITSGQAARLPEAMKDWVLKTW